MFARVTTFALFILSAFAVLAVATPGGWQPTTSSTKPPVTTTVTVTATAPATTTTVPASQCNTGPVQCCNSVQSANSAAASALFGLLGIVLQNLNVLVGITCTPISVIGAGGDSCDAQPVCCENNDFNGVIAIGCTPVNLNL